MLSYLFKRLIYFVPTLFLISLIIFFLSKCAGEKLYCEDAPSTNEQMCLEEIRLRGYDKPIFYFSLTTSATPDTLYKFLKEEQRHTLKRLIGQYGNWTPISTYYHSIKMLDNDIASLEASSTDKQLNRKLIKLRKVIPLLYTNHKHASLESQMNKIEKIIEDSSTHQLQAPFYQLQLNYKKVVSEATPYKLYIPKVHWYGFDNQYHYWLSNFLAGDMGKSKVDFRPIGIKIIDHLPYTLLINISAIILAFLLSIPIGVYAAVYKGSFFDRSSSFLLLLLYSLPVFWIGTLLVNFFTTNEYGTKIFPSIGLNSNTKDIPFWSQLGSNIPHLILPIICTTYGSLAFLTRQVRSSMLEVLNADFIRTARAKGLGEKIVIWKHGFKNALFPLITILGRIIPNLFAGSVVIEIIFRIPGMGLLMWNALFSKDWPVVYAVLMVAAILTIIGLLLADILYALIDPRVKFK